MTQNDRTNGTTNYDKIEILTEFRYLIINGYNYVIHILSKMYGHLYNTIQNIIVKSQHWNNHW